MLLLLFFTGRMHTMQRSFPSCRLTLLIALVRPITLVALLIKNLMILIFTNITTTASYISVFYLPLYTD
uniref:Oligopeptide transporter 1-like isoform X2 n=1 Tax=Rhizophora mucronata TaxID=61149 RepID=A0A2P2PHS4_RHIMU